MKAINLLPPDLRGTAKRGAPKSRSSVVAEAPAGIGAYVVLGALAACVLALAAYVLTTNTVKDRQAKLDATTAQAAATTQRVAQLKPYADFQAMAETRIQTVKDLASSRFDWEQAMRDVSRAIPADVTLSSLTGSVSTASGGGSSVRTAIAAPALELKGCTRGQKQVAMLLSRAPERRRRHARQPRQVDQAGRRGGWAPPRRPLPRACGKGRPPAFEIVAFFEGSKVPGLRAGPDRRRRHGAGATPAAGATHAAQRRDATPTPTPTPQGGGS